MPSSTISQHWQKELEVFLKNLIVLKQQMNADAVHDIRVAVKKLRSYLKLFIALTAKKATEKLFSGTENLFAVLGRQRNIEVSRQLVSSYAKKDDVVIGSLENYFLPLFQQTQQNSRTALQQYDDKPLTELTGQLILHLETLNQEEVLTRIKKITEDQLKLFKHDLKDFNDKYHKERKRLKDIYYWSMIVPAGLVFTKPELKSVNKILDHLGSAQDHDVLVINLKNYRRTILSKKMPEYAVIKKMEVRAGKKKEVFLAKANEMTKELLQEHKKGPKIKDRNYPGVSPADSSIVE